MRILMPALVLLFDLLAASVCLGEAPLLLRQPTLNRDHIVFVFAGDLWRVNREGGEAARLTSHPAQEQDPKFSPDGSHIAFTAEYDGNVDVYVMPSAGGVPRRLTFHPGPDSVVGWAPSGDKILFRSSRHRPTRETQLFTLSVNGGFPTAVPLPMAEEGSFSPDSARMAYVPARHFQRAWKRYRGGQTSPIWVANLSDSSVEPIPRENSNDFEPMWVGGVVYFLSDRKGPVSLFAFDTTSKSVRQILPNEGLDLKSAAAGPGAIVYEQFGSLHLLDLSSRQSRPVEVRLSADFGEVRPRFKKVESKDLQTGRLSPTGQRAVFEMRGEILTVPADKGDVRNLTRTSGVAERDPSWSPDGKQIAYFSDDGGEYALHLQEQSGLGETRALRLGATPSFYYSPVWSPDGKRIAYTDKRLNVWLLNLDEKEPVRVDADTYDSPIRLLEPVWSPDSRWIAYAKLLRNHLHAIFIYSVETGRGEQVTDGLSDAVFPTFDTTGKYIYFAASTDTGLTRGWLDLSSINRPITRSLYVVVLDKTLPSPLAPESDEEKIDADKTGGASDQHPESGKTDGKAKKEEKSKETNAPPALVKIDFDNLSQRILALPMPAKNYKGLAAGKTNTLWVLEGPSVDPFGAPPELALHKFDLTKRKAEKFVDGLKAFAISHHREKLLYRKGDQWFIVGAEQPPKGDEAGLKFGDFQIAADPPTEWRQMYREVWRIQRDFLYDPSFHGLDLKQALARYEPFLAGLASRADLNYLFEEMLGELTLGHVYVRGGDQPEVKTVKVGLLGADFIAENNRYRFTRIYNGENWNPDLRAPLTEPGVNVAAGEYLISVDGRDLTAAQNLFSFFQDKADKIVTLRVGLNADGTGSRDVKVKPVDNERTLRYRAWVEDNRRRVDELSQGRIAYVHLPNTSVDGYLNFNRYYFAQVGKEAAVLDERFNGGGFAADYVIDHLRRPAMNYFATREGEDFTTPICGIFGPKTMIINQFAGSGGDLMPWLFRRAGLGPLIGKRTWGGHVGINNYPTLLDGGSVTAPRVAFFNLDGGWEIENAGVTPDIEVELDPRVWRDGQDLQLDKAVEVTLEALRRNPPAKRKRPAYPNYHRK